MRIYEFDGVDVGRLMEESIKLSNNELTESTSDNTDYVNSFLESLENFNIIQSSLQINSWYYPTGVVTHNSQQLIELYLTTDAVKFLEIIGSRLKFETKNNAVIYFSSDEGLVQRGYKFVMRTRDEVDQIVSLTVLKFSNNDWVLRAFAYSDDGKISQISNIK